MLLALALTGCDETNSPAEPDVMDNRPLTLREIAATSQLAIVDFYYRDHHYDEDLDRYVEEDNYPCYLSLMGPTVPEFQSLQVNSMNYNSENLSDDFFYNYGLVTLDSYEDPLIGNPSELQTTVTTGAGTISGTIATVDSLENLAVDAADDSLDRGDPLTITWDTVDGATYYMIYFGIQYYDPDTQVWDYDYYLDLATSNTFTLPGAETDFDGMITWLEVVPVVGPEISATAVPNMTGDGYGFLYCSGYGTYYDNSIIVGDEYNAGAAAAVLPRSVRPSITELLLKEVGFYRSE
jgi:hypothetical protein